MNKKYNEFLNEIWTSFHGKRCLIKDLEDTHLANIINFLSHSCMIERLNNFKRLAKSRGLTNKFLNRAQIPYKNPKGKWEIWDETYGLIEIGGGR